MQKLRGSLKLLLQIPRKHSHQSHQFKNLFDCASEPNLTKHLYRSHIHEYRSFSHSCLNSRPSWRPNFCNVSDGIRGFLANPNNVYFQNWRRIFLDSKVRFLRSQFPMRNFNNPFGSSSHFGWRSWFPSAEGTVWRLIVANAAVFMLWRVADPSFMRRNFTISVENFKNGRIHTLITAAFSHIEIEHLLSNMIGLYFFGNSIGRMFGPEYVMKLYLAGAVVGSIFYLVHHALMSPSSKGSGIWYVDPSRIPGMGASGALNAIMLLDIFLFPTAIHYVNFFIPVPAMLLGAFLIGKDLLRMKEGNSQISGSAHLGGAVVAALAWARIKKGWF
ncbi:hypothetical protein Sjap_014947 [Stephania japonica]|uniref:Peptidase S54 rhomboid domain-containing protein n=1 Tax=Stephania japonica TaxID=461633 RepID=A0AAP0IIN9_9MAGN